MTAMDVLMWPVHNAGALIVIVGLLTEFIAESKRFEAPEKARLKKRISHTGILIIVLGVAVEIWESGKQSEKLAIATKLAGEAHERAANAELELERIKAPRTITDEQREKFISTSKDYPKGAIKIGVRHPDSETSAYKRAIKGMLIEAGYTITSDINYNDQLGLLSGTNKITLVVATDAPETNPPHGQGFITSLEKAGLGVVIAENRKSTNAPHHPNRFKVEAGELMLFVFEKRL